MLVLTRKPNESVIIGDEIRVSVLSVRGDRVQLGFSAPDDVAIHRAEVQLRVNEFLKDVATGDTSGHPLSAKVVG